MLGVLGWILFGLIVGVIAKLLRCGPDLERAPATVVAATGARPIVGQ